MCEYCDLKENKYRNKRGKEFKMRCEAYAPTMQIVEDSLNGIHIEAMSDGTSRVSIKYCPFCGRSLD
jgi:hypothetical protein